MKSVQQTWQGIEGDTAGKRGYGPPFMGPGWLTVYILSFFTSCAGEYRPRLEPERFNQAYLNPIISIA
jgi:hypothetical protein